MADTKKRTDQLIIKPNKRLIIQQLTETNEQNEVVVIGAQKLILDGDKDSTSDD